MRSLPMLLALLLWLVALPVWAGGGGGGNRQAQGQLQGQHQGQNQSQRQAQAQSQSLAAANAQRVAIGGDRFRYESHRQASSAADLVTYFKCQDVAASAQGVTFGGAFTKASEACLAMIEGLKLMEVGEKLNSNTFRKQGAMLLQHGIGMRVNRIDSFANKCLGWVPFVFETSPGSGHPLNYRWYKRCLGETVSLGFLDFSPHHDVVESYMQEVAARPEPLPPVATAPPEWVPLGEGWTEGAPVPVETRDEDGRVPLIPPPPFDK